MRTYTGNSRSKHLNGEERNPIPTALVLTTAISEAEDICVATSFDGTMLSFYADQTTSKQDKDLLSVALSSLLLLYHLFPN